MLTSSVTASIQPNSSLRNPQFSALHKIIKNNFFSFIEEKERKGKNLPLHVQKEFKRYLTCGILDHGFLRLQCPLCKNEKFVPFSCKGRTLCPRCIGRRMHDLTIHLLENVIPPVAVRQWVLTFPFKHRLLLSYDSKLTTQVLNIVIRVISTFYRQKGKLKKIRNGECGSITTIQRFGSALNLNTHFHILFMDGVFDENLRFIELTPSSEDVKKLIQIIQKRIDRKLIKLGLLDDESCVDLGMQNQALLEMNSLGVQNLIGEGEKISRPKKIGKYLDPPFVILEGTRCTSFRGYTLHANTKIPKNLRSHLEKLCLYVNRTPLSSERVELTADGKVRLKLKTPFSDGTTHLEYDPHNFISRLASLIPPPRMNLVRYHGIFGAHHKKRAKVTAKVGGQKKKKSKNIYRTPWADLLKRVFLKDVSHCDRCGETLKVIASIVSPSVCQKILKHLKIDQGLAEFKQARGPPMFKDTSYSTLDFDQNQELNW